MSAPSEHPGWVSWALHFVAWTLLAAAAASMEVFYPAAGHESSWWSEFARLETTLALQMSLMTIGAAELTAFTWRLRFGVWRRLLSYAVGALVWAGLSAALTPLLMTFTGTANNYPAGQTILPSVVLFSLAVAGASGIHFLRRIKEKDRVRDALTLKNSQLESELTQLQLHRLKAQLQPHFLFNTHNAIAGLIRTGDTKGATSMLAGLSDLLRRSLALEQEDRIPFRDEMDFVRCYLALEQIRFQDRLTVEETIDESLADVLVPSMILQPIVENAMRHGIAESLGTGTLKITATRDNGFLTIRVSNDGPLLPDDWDLEAQQGIGLRNTRSRLEKHFGSESEFRIGNRQDRGVQVELRLPLA